MPAKRSFEGFSRETIEFLKNLAENNNREWFESHRDDYERYVMEPAKAFVTAMGARLRTVVPKIVAVPKVNKSLFRINRDTRFSLNKSPYKTNLGIYFWEGLLRRMDSPGFYFHVEPPKLLLGSGTYIFSDPLLGRFRRAVVHPKLGKELTLIMKKVSRLEGFVMGGKHYKRLPPGHDPRHPNAYLLLHNGLHFSWETEIPEAFYSTKIIDYCFERYRPFVPLHKWLVAVLA